MTSTDPLLTTQDVAALLRVHPKHVYRLRQRGLPGHRVGGEWRYRRDEILAWTGAVRPAESAAEAPPPGSQPVAPAAPVAPPPLLACNGDIAVDRLLRRVNELAPPALGLIVADRDRALSLLLAGAVLAAGCHGLAPPSHAGPHRLARIQLVVREVGLAGVLGAEPPRLEALNRAGVRLVSRPASAGIRVAVDAALAAAGLRADSLHRGATLVASHAEVASALCRREADFGFTTRAWAAQLGLPFTVVGAEAYGLLVRARDLGEAALVRLCEVAQSTAFRSMLGGVAGYDVSTTGNITFES